VLQVVSQTWQERAACRGPSSALFFPPAVGERKEEREQREALAKSICATCVVRNDCLDAALASHELHGIWGGLNETERRELPTRVDC
jgi:WhiB family transcriptional regulator, redox-sensing transcriptional regulator